MSPANAARGAAALGATAKAHVQANFVGVQANFVGDLHLLRYAALFQALVAEPPSQRVGQPARNLSRS